MSDAKPPAYYCPNCGCTRCGNTFPSDALSKARTYADSIEMELALSESVCGRLNEENDSLQAQVEALRAEKRVSEWQPIETAPKDGTEVLIGRFLDGKLPTKAVASFHPSEGWRDAGDIGWGGMYAHVRPTHWMPLPSPPNSG